MIVTALTVLAVVTAVGAVPVVQGRAIATAGPATDAADRPITGTPTRRSLLMVPAVVATAIGLGLFPATALVVVVVGWPSSRRLLAARARQRAIEAAVPDAIDLLILLVHAGMTPHQAVVILGDRGPAPVRPALCEVRRRVARGAQLAEALDALPELLGPTTSAVADTLAMSERYGTPIGHALEQLALDVRDRRRRHAEAEARKLPVRMAFPLVCCTLPSFVLLAIVPAVLGAMASLDTGGI